MKNKKIENLRFIIAGIVLFFAIFVLLRIFFDESKNFSAPLVNNTTMFPALWGLIILCSLVFLYILLRNFLKLYFPKLNKEKTSIPFKSGRFKKRLMFFFVSFSILPTLLLFFFATDIISNGIDKWFRADIESIMNKFEDLSKSYYDKAKDDLKHFARLIAQDILYYRKYLPENRSYLHSSTKRMMRDYNLDVVNIYRNRVEEVSLFNPTISLQEYNDLPQKFLYSELGGGDPIKSERMKDGLLLRNGINFETNEGDRIIIIIGKFFPEKYISSLNTLSNMVEKYEQFKIIKSPVKNTYILLFIFITILIIFSASWLGLYLARDITNPIEKVITAAKEITKGNLDVRIDYSSKDEFNTMVSTFNNMVSDLKENRDKLNKRTIELRQRRSITEDILKHITTGVVALNAKGMIIEINPGAEGMLSIKYNDVVKRHFSEVIASEAYRDIFLLIEKALSTNFKIIEKEVDVKIGGKILKLATKITQLRNPINNRFSGILVVLNDLTELIKAQQMMVWREVAKRIAHEIKNPLTPITISSQRILKAIELPDERFRKIVEDSLNIILQELDAIKSLAEEFSNFARLPESKFTMGDINEVLEKLIATYISIYSGIDFKVNLDVEIPMMVKMDIGQIKQSLVNIIDNAIQAMNERGTLEICTRYNPESQFIRIEIADQGPGISDEDKQNLFVPYFSKKSTGTGLGLAITHNIIEEHNGMISVVDNTPCGARFIVEIPA